MNLHERGQNLLNRVTRSVTGTGVSVLYTRGATTAAMVATVSQEGQDATASPTPGTRRTDRERDYLIVSADLVATGFGEPAEGDRVSEVLNGEAVAFELTRKPGEPAWRWADGQRTRVRLHTKRVS